MVESNSIRQAQDLSALRCYFQGPAGQIHSSYKCTRPRKIHGVGAYSATHLQNPLVFPSGELGEGRNMRLHKVLSPFNLVEVFPCSNWLRRMPDITGLGIPIILYSFNWNLVEQGVWLPRLQLQFRVIPALDGDLRQGETCKAPSFRVVNHQPARFAETGHVRKDAVKIGVSEKRYSL